MASQITSLSIVCSTICCSGVDKKNVKVPLHWRLKGEILRWPVVSPHKGPGHVESVSMWWRHHKNQMIYSYLLFLRENHHQQNIIDPWVDRNYSSMHMDSLTKSPLKLGHERFITFYCLTWMQLLLNIWYKWPQLPRLKCFSSLLAVVCAQSILARC